MNMQNYNYNMARLYVHIGDFNTSTYLRLHFPAKRLAKLHKDEIVLTESRIYVKDIAYVKNGVFVVQRLGGMENLDIMKFYLSNSTAMNYSIVYDVDDLIMEANALKGGQAGDGVPEYNYAGLSIDKVAASVNIEIMKQCHTVTASTDCLKSVLAGKGFGNVRVVPNKLERTIWDIGDKLRTPRQKPLVLYSGSLTHWRERMSLQCGLVLGDHPGDFEGWEKFLVKWIQKNWIDFHIISDTIPYFLKEVESKIIRHPTLEYMDYPLLLKQIDPDFMLCPLAENKFNKCKSDLKAMEAVALNSLPFGTVFKGTQLDAGPYHKWADSMITNADEIEDKFDKLMKPDNYREVQEKFIAMKKDIWLTDEFVEKVVRPAWNLV